MSLNQGIQKYRESVRKATAKNSPAKTTKPSNAKAKGEELPPEEVRKAMEDSAEAEEAAKEEASLQKEIAEELEREASHTAQLVKEDFSPVNSSRDQLILEYAPLIKYIAQKI